MPDEGFSPSHCLDFDLAVMAWGDAFTSYRDLRVPRVVPSLKANQAMVPKYGSDWDVLTKVYGVGRKEVLDPIVAGMTEADLAALLPEW